MILEVGGVSVVLLKLNCLGFCDYVYDTFNCFRQIPAGETLYYQCQFASLSVCSEEPTLTAPSENGTFCPGVTPDNRTIQYYAWRRCNEDGTWEKMANQSLCDQMQYDASGVFRNITNEQSTHELLDRLYEQSSIWPPLLSIIVSTTIFPLLN